MRKNITHYMSYLLATVFMAAIYFAGIPVEATGTGISASELDIIASDGTVIPYSETGTDGPARSPGTAGSYYEGTGETTDGVVPVIPDDATTFAGDLPEIIIGNDDRTKVTNPQAFPYRTSAFITIRFPSGRSYIASGNLIGADTLLTAGHCVYDPAEGGWATLEVYPAYDGATGKAPFGMAYSSMIYSVSGWINGQSSEYDIAVVKLDRPIGERCGWLGYTDMESGSITITGYPGEMGRQMYTMAGTIDHVSERNTYYTIDSTGGNSGSSVYNSDNQAVAVHAYGSPSLRQNFGTRLHYGLLIAINTIVTHEGNPGNVIDISHSLSASDAVSGLGWTFSNNVYNVHGDVLITGSGTDRIVISGGTAANPRKVTLDYLTLDADGGPAILLQPGAHVILSLKNHNILRGQGLYAGIQTTDATLTIVAADEIARLDVVGVRGAGIGGSGGADGIDGVGLQDRDEADGDNGGNGGTIIINSGNITASSSYGAGIGGGKGGDGGEGRPLRGGDGGDGGAGADLMITGGIVTAKSTHTSAIGGGDRGYADSPLFGSSDGVPGSLGRLTLPPRYTHWNDPEDAGTVYPTSAFVLSASYRYVKIDVYLSIPAPSQPTLQLDKLVYLPGDEINMSWNRCDNTHYYTVYFDDVNGPQVLAGNTTSGTSLSVNAADYSPGTYTAWVTASNVDDDGVKRKESNKVTFYIAEPLWQGQTVRVSLAGGLPRCYAFTPVQDGTYSFRSGNKEVRYMMIGAGYPYMFLWDPNTYPEGKLYTRDLRLIEPVSDGNTGTQGKLALYQASDSFILGGMDFIKKYKLSQGETYLFFASNYDEFNQVRQDTDQGAFDLFVVRGLTMDEAMPIDPSYSPTVDVDEANSENYFVFVPSQNGVYTFESLDYGDQEPVLTLYDADGTVLKSSRSSLWHLLEAGKSYYISASLADGATGSYRLSVAGEVYQAWSAGTAYEAGQVIVYGSNADGGPALYIVLQSHDSMSHWLPNIAPSLYKYIDIPLWTQPIGIHDAYDAGDKVIYNGEIWRSDIDDNVWVPGVAGWTITDDTAEPPAAPPAWRQPLNSSDAYPLGARVLYNGKIWESTVNANVWAPGVAGWVMIEMAGESAMSIHAAAETEVPAEEEAPPAEETDQPEVEEPAELETEEPAEPGSAIIAESDT